MGKVDTKKNVPINSSFSFTLENYRSFVEIELNNDPQDRWEKLDNTSSLDLSENGKHRFLQHVQFLKNYFDFNENFTIRSTNNFPSDCGLASSASSYAALTLALCEALTELKQSPPLKINEMAKLSQQASGSSCRSFYSPWCLWKNDHISPIELPYKKLIHYVIMADGSKKLISSSEAHKRVRSSLIYKARDERAETRLNNLLEALKNRNWPSAYEICWQEFWDMHALFETSSPPFGYMNSSSLMILNHLREFWQKNHDGPIITMDAGANVHCLFREDQFEIAHQLKQFYSTQYSVITNNDQ